MRELLHEQLRVEQLQRYEEEINAALAARLPKAFNTNRLEAAVDEHDEPYYGQSATLRPYVARSRARAGVTRFFRIYSLYPMCHFLWHI
jgi:predicted ATPase with chaperone activity